MIIPLSVNVERGIILVKAPAPRISLTLLFPRTLKTEYAEYN